MEDLCDRVLRYRGLVDDIHDFWLLEPHQLVATWTEHQDINDVMLAASLLPDGFLCSCWLCSNTSAPFFVAASVATVHRIFLSQPPDICLNSSYWKQTNKQPQTNVSVVLRREAVVEHRVNDGVALARRQGH